MLHQVSVVTWNVQHQIRCRPIPKRLGTALITLNPDVLFLDEFVDGPERAVFRDQLREAGYIYQDITDAPPRHNHVFAASRVPIERGDIAPPILPVVNDEFAQSNFLHLRLQDSDLELIGIRAPWWDSKTNRLYRAELTRVLRSVAEDRALVVAGDINEDPFKSADTTASSVKFRDAEMFAVQRPEGPWRFTNHDGSRATSIDHVLHTRQVKVSAVRYIDHVSDITLAGPKSTDPVSDHAALTFTATLTRQDAEGLAPVSS